ncbi:hypothetical protein VDR05_19230, partial [Xanthomonas campestris pv. campestris]|nr:hypothetical protein [Xanthomonas campestris pv. campestris]
MAVLVVVAVGLIEWNARRQAAAMTAELMRPMTPSEQRQLNRQLVAPEKPPSSTKCHRRQRHGAKGWP